MLRRLQQYSYRSGQNYTLPYQSSFYRISESTVAIYANIIAYLTGTQDRVVLIQGTAEGLIKVHSTIVEKVYDFPVPKDLAAIIGDRAKQVLFL